MIYELSKALARFGYHQAKNIVKLFLGYPLTTPSLGSVTLDHDDLLITKNLLRNKKNWFNPDIVKKYERAFAKWNGSKYAFAFMGGRVALSACIYALNLKPGDEVILPGYTCVVVPNAFHFAGVKTTYSDIELDTYGLDTSLIEEKITPKTKAILLHHLYGLVCRDYEKIIEIARKHKLYVVEDCSQSTGAAFKNRKIGNFGDVAIYSSEQSKVFTTIQGGMAVTNDDLLAERLKDYYGQASYPGARLIDKQLHSVIINYYSYKDPQRWWKRDLIRLLYSDKIIISTTKEEEQGIKPTYYGCKMPSPIAAIGLNQLKKIDHYNEQRRQTAKKWDEWCENNGYKKPLIIQNSISVYLRYPVVVETEKKSDTSWAYKKLGITLGVWFVSNIHPATWQVDGCPNANKAVKRCINFPTILN
ncbi:MAG: aminotransferase class I/II-fold pyridoxal phosphate-dependent enzyme [Desulfobacula sp.]|nr:aminotransferase class I/II-fold pyridoxal phosphate-dependent enzyme [Desulfobacula sp.]